MPNACLEEAGEETKIPIFFGGGGGLPARTAAVGTALALATGLN